MAMATRPATEAMTSICSLLNPLGRSLRDARVGVQTQSTGGCVGEEVEEDVTVDEVHYLTTQILHDALRVVALEQPRGRIGQQFLPARPPTQGSLGALPFGLVRYDDEQLVRRLPAFADERQHVPTPPSDTPPVAGQLVLPIHDGVTGRRGLVQVVDDSRVGGPGYHIAHEHAGQLQGTVGFVQEGQIGRVDPSITKVGVKHVQAHGRMVCDGREEFILLDQLADGGRKGVHCRVSGRTGSPKRQRDEGAASRYRE